MITFFVLVMMLLIEYLTVQSKGRWYKQIERNPMLQLLVAAILGVVPGCVGGFMAVSMYAHRILNFGALITTMIASSGDEAFVMFSLIPRTAVKLNIIIFVIALAAGYLVNVILKNRNFMIINENHFHFHSTGEHCFSFESKTFIPQLRRISFQRFSLLSAVLLFIFMLVSGKLGDVQWNIEKFAYLFVSLIGLFIITTVPDHFLNEHLWEHVIKKHLARIFLWTVGAFILIYFLKNFIDVEMWIKHHQLPVLILACLIGIIPESGPHIVFITLFASGSIPFSVLLANSIVQDGHSALPLLAESGRSFIWMKLINFAVGLLVGAIGLYFPCPF